jgi:hypothetical protein
MITVGSLVQERIEQIQHVRVIPRNILLVGLVLLEGLNPVWMISVAGNFLQYLNLPCLLNHLLNRKKPIGNGANSSLSSPQHNSRI